MKIKFLSLFVCISTMVCAQNNTNIPVKRRMYFMWGYTRAWYNNTDIHFQDHSGKYHPQTDKYNNYDFTIYNATARDRPDFKWKRDIINITIPQFVARIGFRLNRKWDLEFNYDHTKYVVDDYQKVKIDGQIFGKPVGGDTILDPNQFLHFEHTDGANFAMLNAVRKWRLLNTRNFACEAIAKPGAGVVFPRTDVTIFGEHLNNNWHVAGWIFGLETGIRLVFFKKFTCEITTKGSYANYARSLVLGKGNGNANHYLVTKQFTVSLGYMFKQRHNYQLLKWVKPDTE